MQVILNLYKEVFDDITIDELLEKQHHDLSVRIKNLTHEGLGYVYIKLVMLIFSCYGASKDKNSVRTISNIRPLFNMINLFILIKIFVTIIAIDVALDFISAQAIKNWTFYFFHIE